MTLLHYIVDVAVNENPGLLEFTTQLSSVKEARRLSLETLASELRGWKSQVDQLQKQMINAEADLADFMKGFTTDYMCIFKIYYGIFSSQIS